MVNHAILRLKINYNFSHFHCWDTLHRLVTVAKNESIGLMFSNISIYKGNDSQYLTSDLIHIILAALTVSPRDYKLRLNGSFYTKNNLGLTDTDSSSTQK